MSARLGTLKWARNSAAPRSAAPLSPTPADRFIEVDYEELTGAPEPVIRRIIAACGLDWDDACLHPERNPRAVKTPSKWQTRQPIYRGSVARWRRYEPFLGPLGALLDDGRSDAPASGSFLPAG